MPLLLVALLIYTVATSLLLNFRQRGYKHLDDETVIDWVRTPGKSEGEVGEIIRYTQDEVGKLDEVYSRFSEVFASRLPFFERRLVFLNTLVATAPLLGLLTSRRFPRPGGGPRVPRAPCFPGGHCWRGFSSLRPARLGLRRACTYG